MSYYRDQLESWLKTIDVKAERVLDIGGGANPVRGRTKSWEVEEYIILDNFAEKFVATDCGFVWYDLNYEQVVVDKGDVIFCLEVFEYIFNPIQALKNIYELLKEGGIAYISFPFVYSWHEPKKIDYLRYTEAGVGKLLDEAGFNVIIFYQRKDKSGLLEKFYRADGMHPAKGIDHSVYGYMVKAIK